MKNAQVVHNPTAGDGKHSKNDILEVVENAAEVVDYVSTEEEDWGRALKKQAEVIFLAGGDGTVNKLATRLLQNEQLDPAIPVYLLPYGTANNIGLTLDIPKKIKQPKPDFEKNIRKYDIGRVKGLEDMDFFLEGVGFGLFPELVKRVKEQGEKNETASEELQRIRKNLLEVAKEFKAQKAKIKLDGMKIKGKFLLVELINIRYIGPNFELAPNANPGDGFLDLVLIPEERREDLVAHLQEVLDGKKQQLPLKDFVQNLRVQKVEMQWKGEGVHVDDDLVENYSGESFEVSLDHGKFHFVKLD
ncbi:MAG: diacylglycerol kinase family protein [Salinimicrobium sp.]